MIIIYLLFCDDLVFLNMLGFLKICFLARRAFLSTIDLFTFLFIKKFSIHLFLRNVLFIICPKFSFFKI